MTGLADISDSSRGCCRAKDRCRLETLRGKLARRLAALGHLVALETFFKKKVTTCHKHSCDMTFGQVRSQVQIFEA